jgi:hypothetical protein
MTQLQLAWIFLIFSALSLVVAAGMCLFKDWSERQIEHFGVVKIKVGIEVLQAVPALVAIFGSFASISEKSDWQNPAIVGAICLALARTLNIVVDSRQKAKTDQYKEQAERAELVTKALNSTNVVIRKTVGKMLNGITFIVKKRNQSQQEKMQKKSRSNSADHLDEVRKAFEPRFKLDDLLDDLATSLRETVKHDSLTIPNVRIGLYVLQNDQMEPLHGVSLAQYAYNPFHSHKLHPDRFRITEANNSAHVVQAITKKRTLIVEDCQKASELGEFNFIHEDQNGYLRSLIVYFLGEVHDNKGNLCLAVIAADSDCPNFFKESLLDVFNSMFQDFGLRIQLELSLRVLLKE